MPLEFPNIAGSCHREETIKEELTKAGVEIKEKALKMFPTYGELGKFSFFRGSFYWLVRGDVPLEIAKGIYRNAKFRKNISVVGLNNKARPDDLKRGAKKYVWAERRTKPDKSFEWVIPFYCVTSQEALDYFVTVLKENSLV